jgi:squalene-hopene/tetraprenyl-beta-curcumene cyclase
MRWIVVLLSVLTLSAQTPAAEDAAGKGQAVVDKALNYLKAQQKPDGSWQANEQVPPALTAIALKAFVQDAKYNAKTDFVKKGYDKLLGYQWQDGGIYKDMLANYNTAIAIMAIAAAEDPAMKPAMDKAVAYLKTLQWTDAIEGPKGEKVDVNNPWYGGAGYGRQGRPDGSNTQLMLEALNSAGLPSDDPSFKAALKFLTRMQNLSETNDQPWAGNDGGAIYTPAGKPGGESFAGEYAGADGKRMLRSYGSMTYAMLKSYIYAGLSKDDPRVKAAWDWIGKNWTLEENPGMRAGDPANAQYGMYYYYMTLGRALNAYDQPVITDPLGNKHDWRVELIDQLARLQKPDGSFVGDKKWMEDNPVLATGFAVLAVQEATKDLKEHPGK